MSQKSALVLFKQIETAGSLVLQGYNTLQTLRDAIQLAIRESGYQITFDPQSDPELVDYLTVASTRGLEGAAAGALFGTLIGLLFERPGVGAIVGAGFGAAVGVADGIQRVEQGWRIRAMRTANRMPMITVNSIRAS